jgi:hypothetical protein
MAALSAGEAFRYRKRWTGVEQGEPMRRPAHVIEIQVRSK